MSEKPGEKHDGTMVVIRDAAGKDCPEYGIRMRLHRYSILAS